MKQVKTFFELTHRELEAAINAWIQDCPHLDIIQIQYTTQGQCHYAMLLFEKKGETL